MSGWNNQCRKVEATIAAYLLSAEIPGVSVFRTMDAINSTPLPDDRIEVVCRRSRPMADTLDATSGLTNRYVTCEIAAHSRADGARDDGGTLVGDARDRHDAIVGAIMDALYVDGLPATLSAQGIEGVSIDQVDWPIEELAADASGYMTTITFDALSHSIGETI